VVIMAVGEPKGWTGENASRAFLTLTGNQQELFDAVAATGKPVVTIVFSGRPLALPEVWEKSAAILYAWQPGIEAGNGLADLLVGKVAPSARLSMSVPRTVAQVPIFYNHYNTGRPRSGQYRDMNSMDARFWFGYGLTYTTFEYSPVRITGAADGKPASAVVTITNTGSREGVAVPQMYIRQLVCHAGARPMQELRGFRRLTLKPGEQRDVTFPITGEVLGFTTRDGKWQVDAGEYQIWIAPHAQTGTPVDYTH
jgi:beta-glucosidase